MQYCLRLQQHTCAALVHGARLVIVGILSHGTADTESFVAAADTNWGAYQLQKTSRTQSDCGSRVSAP